MLILAGRFMCVIITLMSSNNLDVNGKKFLPCLDRQITNHMNISLKCEEPGAVLLKRHPLCRGPLSLLQTVLQKIITLIARTLDLIFYFCSEMIISISLRHIFNTLESPFSIQFLYSQVFLYVQKLYNVFRNYHSILCIQ